MALDGYLPLIKSVSQHTLRHQACVKHLGAVGSCPNSYKTNLQSCLGGRWAVAIILANIKLNPNVVGSGRPLLKRLIFALSQIANEKWHLDICSIAPLLSSPLAAMD
jgi:hypothetical protein